MAEFIDYYSLLGIVPDADPSEIRDAFRSAAQAWHADRWSSASAQHRTRAEEMMKRVNAARDTLQDPTRRAEYDDSLRARTGAARTAATSSAGAGQASDRDGIVLACPYCHEEHACSNPAGKWTRLSCRRCGNRFVALVGAVCHISTHRAAGDGMQQFSVRSHMADGTEEVVTFFGSRLTNLRQRDSFSVVYAENVPAAVHNHTQGSFSPLGRRVPARRAGAGPDYIRFFAGLASWLAAFFVLRPGIGDPLYIAAVLVGTPVLAYRKDTPIGPWLAAAVLTAGAATFLLAARGGPASPSGSRRRLMSDIASPHRPRSRAGRRPPH